MPPCLRMSQIPLSAAAAMAGVESRNEKRAAASRLRSRNSAAVMVIPLRDVPGTTASACASPINAGILPGDLAHVLAALAPVLAIHIRIPTTISIVPISTDCARWSSACLPNSSPASPTGIVPRTSTTAAADSGSAHYRAANGYRTPGDDLDPIPKEINDDGSQRSGMQGDVEHQVRDPSSRTARERAPDARSC